MTLYPGDVMVQDGMTWPVFDPATETTADYDFVVDGGYALGDLLDINAQGSVEIYASTSPRFETYLDMVVNGVSIPIDGTGDAHAVLSQVTATEFLFIANIPSDLAGQIIYFKAVAALNGDENPKTTTWTVNVNVS